MRYQRVLRMVLLVVIIGVGLLSMRLNGQARREAPPSGTARAGAVRRASDGHPDLSGVWSFATLTPLERSAEFAVKPVLTDEEAARFEKDLIARTNADNRNRPPEADVALAYNDFWYDRGVHLAVVDGKKRTSLIVDPADGKIPALTPEAQRKANERAAMRTQHAFDDPEARSLGERCLAFGAGPPIQPGPYNNNVQLFQFRDAVVVLNEMIHDARTITLDGRPHLPKAVRFWRGDSRGHWEGDALVVDTTNFTDRTNFRNADENLHLTERFTRSGPDTLLYQYTVDDPTAFTKPWTVVLPMQRLEGQIYEYACHEGNYGLMGILRGARARDRDGKK